MDKTGDARKTKAQLIEELQVLRRQLAKLQGREEGREQAEESPLHERDMLHILMENAPDWIFFKDAESRIVRSNRAHAQLLGFDDPQQVVGKTDFDLFPSKDARRFYDEEQKMLQSGQPVVARLGQTPGKDGEVLWVSETKIPLKDETGRVIGLVGISRDVTEIEKQVEERSAELKREIAERKRVEAVLARESELLQALLDNSPDYVFFKDRESRFIRTNKAHAQNLLGVSDPREVEGKTDFDLYPGEEENTQRFYDEEQELMETGEPVFGREWTVPDQATGEDVWLSEHKIPVRSEDGKVVGLVCIGRDVTSLKQAELALQRRALQLETAAEVSRAASSILDPDELIQQAVELVRERFELYYAGLFLVDEAGSAGEPGGKWAVLRAGTGEAGQQMIAQGHKLEIGSASMIGACVADKQARIALDVGEEAARFDNPFLPETRSELALPLISRGEVIGALTIQSAQEAAFSQEDIAVLQTMADQLANAIANARLYEALEQEQNLMNIFMDNVPDSIYFKDTESRFLRISRAQADMFGLSDPVEVVGKTDFDFFTENHARLAYEDEQAIIRTGQPIIGKEEQETWADRPSTWVSSTKMPMYDKDGGVIGTFGISRDITALKLAEHALAYEGNLLRAMMDGSPEYIFFKDRESRFIRVNLAHAQHLLGLDDPQEAVGKTSFDFFSQEEAQRIHDEEQTTMESDRSVVGQESQVTDSTGAIRWVSESKVPMVDEAGQVIGLIGISRDVSDRKLIERDLQRANEELELYTATVERRAMQLHTAAEVAREATAILDVGQILEQTVNLISDRFGFYHAGVFLIDEQDEYAILRAASSEGGQRMLVRGHKLPIGEIGIVGYVTDRGEPRIAFDVGEDATFFDNPDLPKTRSEMALPLIVHGRIIGALDVQSTESSAFTEEDVTTLQTMADQLAVSIENARLVERTESQLRELSLLYGQYSSSAWADVEATDQAMGYIYDRVDVLPIEDSSVPVLEMALQRGETVTLTDAETVGAALAVPLRMRGQVIGTLGIQQTGVGQEWTPEQIALVEAVSEQVAQALESARLFAETQRTAQSMEALYQTSRALSSSMDEESLMRAILETVYRTLNCEHVLVSTVDEATKTIGIQHGIWQGQFDVFPEWIGMSRYSLDQPDILTDIYRNKQTEVITGWDDRFNREIYEKFGHERFLRVFMPIQLRDHVLGTVEVGYDRRQKERVASDELQMLAAFMDQAAVALERVRLFEQVQQRADREHQIYEIAAKLRRTPDIATILQTAVDELGRALQTDRALVRLRLKPQEEPGTRETAE